MSVTPVPTTAPEANVTVMVTPATGCFSETPSSTVWFWTEATIVNSLSAAAPCAGAPNIKSEPTTTKTTRMNCNARPPVLPIVTDFLPISS